MTPYRGRRERRVFQRLLGIVPHLADRLMECSNEDAMGMADLVRRFLQRHGVILTLRQDSEGSFQREIRRH